MSVPENAKDQMIDDRRTLAWQDYDQWLDVLDQQQEQQAQLDERGAVPSPTGGYHAEILNRRKVLKISGS